MKKWNLIIALVFTIAIGPLLAKDHKDKKIVLVLGSGGNKGLAHIGVIEELENIGIVPDIIVGCSVGAVIGSFYAQSQDISRVKEIFINLKSDDLIDFSFFQPSALSTTKKMEAFLEQHLTVKDFDSLKIPFIAVVTDLHKGEAFYVKQGDLHSMVMASSSLPGLFPPYVIGDNVYVDGGVCDPLPVSFAKSLGKYIVIASDISPSLDGFQVDNVLQVVRKSFEVMYQSLASSERKKADILLEMNFSADLDSPFEDGANELIYERGKEVVREQSKNILKRCKSQ